jgi:hypothetical protein
VGTYFLQETFTASHPSNTSRLIVRSMIHPFLVFAFGSVLRGPHSSYPLLRLSNLDPGLPTQSNRMANKKRKKNDTVYSDLAQANVLIRSPGVPVSVWWLAYLVWFTYVVWLLYLVLKNSETSWFYINYTLYAILSIVGGVFTSRMVALFCIKKQ